MLKIIHCGVWEWKPQCYYLRHAELLVLDWGYWHLTVEFGRNKS